MRLQRSHLSIVRSIRQLSLLRGWLRARGDAGLPSIVSFEPDARAGDAPDLALFKVARHGEAMDYICLHAGERVRAVYDTTMWGRSLFECLEPVIAAAAEPIWRACVATGLPVYAIVPVVDRQGCPVTIEQLVLPYSRASSRPDFIVASLHAWSTEGRFVTRGLLHHGTQAPAHWAVVIDPEATAATEPMHDDLAGPGWPVSDGHVVQAAI
ncbi:hypothetical protein [Bradyrhizobium prioriisuperbiae]|uniref:hypothetical protein n=1 Tax=Bradyrhizobium prioriisuperbiae TaxID=2854389 RepID=UPI0028E35804|nr:hypothetical protein [Bradyrhizobium prioritasuperba]